MFTIYKEISYIYHLQGNLLCLPTTTKFPMFTIYKEISYVYLYKETSMVNSLQGNLQSLPNNLQKTSNVDHLQGYT